MSRVYDVSACTMLFNCVCVTASGMTAAVVAEEEVEEQGWGDDVDIIIDDGESHTWVHRCICIYVHVQCQMLPAKRYHRSALPLLRRMRSHMYNTAYSHNGRVDSCLRWSV